ncbi:MAG: DMT family transporter [Burkholderiales bacterium]
MDHKRLVPDLALLSGAFVWGVIWYPYRVLEHAGVGGASAAFVTYSLALLPALVLFRNQLQAFQAAPLLLVAIALSAGWCNLAYVMAMVRGEVMQVMLLFYLAPLWTVLLSRVLLHERLGAVGYLVVALSLAGAMVMLWRPGDELPLPASAAQWLGLSSGVAFALSNVLSRRAKAIDVRVRSLGVWIGVSVVALPLMLILEHPLAAVTSLGVAEWGLVVMVAAVIFSVNISVQHGLAHTPANRAIVLFLTELIFAATAASWLAGESMDRQQWLGGVMIVAATLFSGRLDTVAERSVARA